MTDVSKHILVPKHTKVSDSEKEKICQEYNVEAAQLPKISIDDPALEKLDVKPGDVVKIERQSVTAGKAAYYRLVVGA